MVESLMTRFARICTGHRRISESFMKRFHRVCALSIVSLFLVPTLVLGADKGNFSVAPKANNGAKWRLGYYEGGPYPDYQASMIATVRALMELGWMEKAEIPPQKAEQTKELWNWLSSQSKSDFLEFVKDAHYSADWNDDVRKKTSPEIIKRLNEQKDIDLMIAAGTWAGKDLANNEHHTDTIVISTSDPVSSGIIKSVEDSGYEHILARVDPKRYQRQIRIFHDIVGFKKLGMAYADTDAGRSYAALEPVREVAKERGFEIIGCFTKDDIPDSKLAAASVEQCFQDLVKKADAIYVTKQNGVNKGSIPDLVAIANSSRIPTFSQSGSEEVKWGFLLSISQAGFKYVGQYYAETIARIFNGARPVQLDQVFEGPPKIAINLRTASIIGFDPPVDTLGAADEIYQEIASP
jgi:ABC-type uncharacterized transport system substrate-binding protein